MGSLPRQGILILLGQASGRLTVILQRIGKEYPEVRDEVQVAFDALTNAAARLRVPPSPPSFPPQPPAAPPPVAEIIPPSPASVAPDSPPAVVVPPASAGRSGADTGKQDAPSTKGGDEKGSATPPAKPKPKIPKEETLEGKKD